MLAEGPPLPRRYALAHGTPGRSRGPRLSPVRSDRTGGRQIPYREPFPWHPSSRRWSTCQPSLPRNSPPIWPISAAAWRRSRPIASESGRCPILVVPPANDAGFEPLRSFLPAETLRAEREAFARDFLAARRLEASDPEHSIEQYRALLARQPGFAESHYRLARLLEDTGAWDEAYRALYCGPRPGRHADALPDCVPASLP